MIGAIVGTVITLIVVRDEAQLVVFRFRDLRHHFANTLEFMNLPFGTIRKRLGHGSNQCAFAILRPIH